MPFVLDGRTIAPDAPFTHDGIQYPANWIRLSTEEEKAAIGMVWQPDPEPFDQRFYWGRQEDGTLIPKDHAQLVEQWTTQTRTTAGTLLAPSDWLVIREQDNGTAVPQEWRDWRESIRLATGTKVAALNATTSTDELAAYVTGSEYNVWPHDPNAPVIAPAGDGLEPAGDGSTADVGLS